MCSYCVKCWCVFFSVMRWWEQRLVCKAVFIDIPCATIVWTFICFLFMSWVDGCCMVIRKLQVIEIFSAIVCKWVLNIVSATVCMGASVWNMCVYATVNAVWAAGFITDYWNTCCSLWCVAVGVHIYKLCLFCEVSIESPFTVLGIQYLLLFRWFLYILVCTIMVIRKEKKVGQGILNNRMRTKGEKIHVRIY